MKIIDKIIFVDLYKSVNGLLIYTLHTRHSIRSKDMAEFIKTYTAIGYLVNDNLKLKLTDIGMNFIESKFPNSSLSSERGVFESIPEEFIGRKIHPEELYIPNRLLMSSIIDNEE